MGCRAKQVLLERVLVHHREKRGSPRRRGGTGTRRRSDQDVGDGLARAGCLERAADRRCEGGLERTAARGLDDRAHGARGGSSAQPVLDVPCGRGRVGAGAQREHGDSRLADGHRHSRVVALGGLDQVDDSLFDGGAEMVCRHVAERRPAERDVQQYLGRLRRRECSASPARGQRPR